MPSSVTKEPLHKSSRSSRGSIFDPAILPFSQRGKGDTTLAATFLSLVAGCALAPSPEPPPLAVELVETYWRVTEVHGKPVPADRGSREPHLFLRREGARVTGFSGCNTLSGAYIRSSGDGLSFGPLAMTRMACLSPEANAVEAGFVKGLDQVARYRIVGTTLELRDRAGQAPSRMEAVTPR
jgi:heat shock protein HslJ